MGILSRAITFTAALGFVAPPAFAQTPDLVRTAGPELEAGDKVDVLTKAGEKHTGRVRTLTDRSLALDTADGLVDLVPAEVGRVVIKDSITNGLLIGLGAGAAGGALLAFFYNALCETENCGAEALGIAALWTGVGAGIGAGIDGLVHETVFDVVPDVPGELSPEMVAYFGGSRTSTYLGTTFRDGGRSSFGAAWGVHPERGIGVELEFSRTFGDASRLVPCTELEGIGDLSGCQGGGRRGIAETTLGSAKVQYFFSKGRAQPYVSAGMAVYSQKFWHSWMYPERFPDGDLVVFEGSGQTNGLAFVGGGGVRIPLGRRFSLKPDVTIYAGNNWTHVRVGAGAGFGW